MIERPYKNVLEELSCFFDYLSLRETFDKESLSRIERAVRISRREALLEGKSPDFYNQD